MYRNPNDLTNEEKMRKFQILKMKQISFDSDLKKMMKKRENLDAEFRDLKRKIDLMQVDLNDLVSQKRKADVDILFLEDELKQVKRQLIALS